MVTWDDSFEASPTDSDVVKHSAGKLRELKEAVRERMELEHNFKDATKPFHKVGLCSIVFVGTTDEINALTGMSTGCLAFDTDLSRWKVYVGFEWVSVAFIHADYDGLGNDDHPQYLKLNKSSQTLLQNLLVSPGKTVDGRDVGVDGAKLDSIPYLSGFGTWYGLHPPSYTYFVNKSYVASTDLIVAVYGSATIISASYTCTSDGVTALILKPTAGAPEAGIFPVRKNATWRVDTFGSLGSYLIRSMSIS